MTRVALLVAVLAALCYTSQAIPVQVENVEGTQALPYRLMDSAKEMFDSFLETAKEKSKVVFDEAKNVITKFYEEGQKAKDKFNKKVEELQKLYQQKKTTAEQFYKQLKDIAQETEEELKVLLKNKCLKVEELIKNMINDNDIKRELEEILAKLPKGQNGETYGFVDDMKDYVENELKKCVEKLKEMAKEIKEKGEEVTEELKKRIEEAEDFLKQGWENWGWKNLGDITTLLDLLKKEVLNVLNDQQVQQASLTTSYGIEGIFEGVERIVRESLKGADKITRESLKMPGDILRRIGFLY